MWSYHCNNWKGETAVLGFSNPIYRLKWKKYVPQISSFVGIHLDEWIVKSNAPKAAAKGLPLNFLALGFCDRRKYFQNHAFPEPTMTN